MATALCLPKMRNKLNHAYTVLIILSRHHKKTEINLKKKPEKYGHCTTAALKRYR